MLDFLTESQTVGTLGWALLHSIWQIALVALALFVALRFLRERGPNIRYALSVGALALAVVLPASTFVAYFPDDARSTMATADSISRANSQPEDVIAAEPGRASVGGSSVASSDDSSAISLTNFVRTLKLYIAGALPFAVVAWFLGVVFFSLRLTGGFAQLHRYRTTASVNDEWVETFSRLCAQTGVTRAVRFCQSEIVLTPIAIGIIRPAIIVPASLFLQITPRELETIIAHELIHIRRYDPIVNLAQCVIETVLFYHPAIWWISTQIRREREFAADAAVVSIFEDSHVTYARALANLEEIRLRTNMRLPRYATAANGGNFMQRIQKILKIKTEASTANSAWTAFVALLLTSGFLLAIFSISSSEVVNAQERSGAKKLAIGFVSIPPVDRTSNAPKDADATSRLLIQELKEHKVPAIGFLQGGMVSDGEKLFPVRAEIARLWIDSGFEVGLGGFKHVWLHNTPVDEYIANIEKNERIAKQLIGNGGLPPRYFSYPFLNTGKAVEEKAKVESWLASRGYTSVKYTFDNSEWMYSYAYDMARNDNDVPTMKEIRKAYLDYMSRMFDHYEAYSSEMFGRQIPQTMVLTPSRLITDTADDFFAMAMKRGYTFITVDEAQSDAAYKTKEDFVGTAGISWFERWAFAKGMKLLAEPAVDPAIERTWTERQLKAKK